MKVLVVLGLVLAIAFATPVDEVDKVEELVSSVVPEKEPIISEPSVQDRTDPLPNLNLANLVGASNVANLTAIIQQLVREEVKNILLALQSAQSNTVSTLSGLINSDESSPSINKQEVEKQAEKEAKPVYFLPRRPGYFPPHHPLYYGPQEPVPYYNEEPYFYRGGPQWRRINPTDESLSDMDALAQLELLLNEKGEMSSEARGLMSSLSSTTNSAKASFKSFVNSLSAALPSFSIVRKTYLVPGLAING
ncbi:uncharacterized protein LOC130700653 [Daphnia carinata]|uniref:uncharacterized protein LOC130700653 n=1 Tax=Daphnia carinata TaxID=120202 RepID=UPI00257D98EB|nr:uncharacterized protein LOC130700653 [Daphnia carinata]